MVDGCRQQDTYHSNPKSQAIPKHGDLDAKIQSQLVNIISIYHMSVEATLVSNDGALG